MKHTRQDLNIMQGWSLEKKIKVSQMKILEWYRAYNGQVFTSFSGGKDSTVLLDLARQVCPDIPAVYVDTGLEYPELRDFVKTKDNVICFAHAIRLLRLLRNTAIRSFQGSVRCH